MSENNVKANVEIPTKNDTSISKYNIPYVLEQIEELHTELQSLEETVKSIQSITDVKQNSISKTPDEEEHEVTREVVESVAISKVDAIVEIFHQREESLRKLLAFYEKMYDDLKLPQKTNKANKTKCEKTMGNKMIAHSKENGKSVISISNDARYYIWELVSGWPDIISNEENLKIIADLNMTNSEIMEITTNILYQIFHRIDTDREVIIRVENTSIANS